MPSQAAQKAKAERFLALYEKTPAEDRELAVICLFYCAVHIVEMVANSQGKGNGDHTGRREYLLRHHQKAWTHYRPLAEYGWDARYDPEVLELTPSQVDGYLRKKRLHGLMKWAEEVLGPIGILEPSKARKVEIKPAVAIRV